MRSRAVDPLKRVTTNKDLLMWTCPKCSKKVDDTFEICWSCGTSIDGVEDPHFLEEGNLGKKAPAEGEEQVAPESLVTLTKCSLPGEAHAIRVRLESEGVPVFLFDEFTVTMDWLLSNAIGGIKVQVPEPHLERARTILGIVEAEQEAAEDQDDEEGDELYDDESDAPLEEGIIDREKLMDTPADQGIIDKNEMKD